MRCGVKEITIKRQETKEKEAIKCFRYWGERHYKWECPNIIAEKERRRKEKKAYVVRPQKTQQKRRLTCSIQEKTQEYCEEKSMPPEGILLLERGWLTEEVVLMYVDCRGYKGKKVQIYENQGQGLLLKRQVRNIWYNLYQKAWNWREEEAKRGEITRVQYIKYRKKDIIEGKMLEQEKREILYPEYRTKKKKPWQNQEVVVCPIEEKVQYTNRDSKKHSNREGQSKGYCHILEILV